jgi:predicted dehydrogenase
MKKTILKRRDFLSAAGAAVAAVAIVPRHAVAKSGETPPSEMLNIAGIGVGSMGQGDVKAVAGGNNIVALCDVDWGYDCVVSAFKDHPKAERFRDFRKLFDKMDKQIDAVVVATPDHNHAVAAIAAIQRGKHVYCEKPLAHSVAECRAMAKAAREHKVVTQMGNQGHSFESCRLLVEWLRDGAIGKVHTIHCGCNVVNSGIDRLADLKKAWKAPERLDWDLWLGPTRQRPYCPAFLPYVWRGWVPFGGGTICDWVCHVVDPVFWALDLGAPKSIVSETPGYDIKTQGEACPKGEKITYEFAAKGDRGPVTLHWYSGTVPMPRPADLEPGRHPFEIGAVVLGDKGTIMYGSHGAGGVRIIPEAKMRAYKLPPKSIPRAKEHHQDWLNAIRTGGKAGSDFSYGAALSEVGMLGVIAGKLAGTKLEWDGESMKFTNSPEANALVTPAYRPGWSL